MKTSALSLAALLLALASLTAVQAAPVPAGTKATVKVNGKTVKKVPVQEGKNVIHLSSGHKIEMHIKDGKVTKKSVSHPRRGEAAPNDVDICFLGFCVRIH